MKTSRILSGAIFLFLFGGLILWQGIVWTLNRWEVPVGYSLMLRYKGPLPFEFWSSTPIAPEGQFASVDENGGPVEVGILEDMVGPGRHFYCPLWWEGKLVKDTQIGVGEVGVVTSRVGKILPEAQIVVDGEIGDTEFRGVLRRVLGPGKYRLNTYGYGVDILKQQNSMGEEKLSGWVEIRTGYVGVVTKQTKNEQAKTESGLQKETLPPGIYLTNPKEQQIDHVEVGFREKTITFAKQIDANNHLLKDTTGEPIIDLNAAGGITFPSKDGFRILMDFTAIWGIMPEQAPMAIANYGNINQIEEKVILPQVSSICRNKGSALTAVELLVGDSRQKFQKEVSQQFDESLKQRNLTLQTGLVRYIYIPQEIRTPIQAKHLADELTITRTQQEQTAKIEADLRKAEQQVELEGDRTKAETEKKIAEQKATGEKEAAEIRAETAKLIAELDKQTAQLETDAKVMLGEAKSYAEQKLQEAKAERFQLAVEAFGSPQAYNMWVFAEGMPADVELNLVYAGEGTFWTDLKGFTETMMGRQIRDESKSNAP